MTETVMVRDYLTSRLLIERTDNGTYSAAWRNPAYGGYWAHPACGGFGFASIEEAEHACIEAIEECCGRLLAHEGRPLQFLLSNGSWTDVRGTGASYIAAAVRHYAGRFDETQILSELRAGKFARTGTDWYDKIRFAPAERHAPEPDLMPCDCGHECERSLRMIASLGSSCPDCYDRMSDASA